MPIIRTGQMRPGDNPADQLQIYNALDCCLTFEVFEQLQTLFNREPEIYTFERALQAPALEMMLRGFLVDETERRQGVKLIEEQLARLDSILQQYAYAVWGRPLNPRSPKQLLSFFYETMKLPKQFINQKGQRKLSMNREVLEKLEVYHYAMPIVACILAIRDLSKQLEVLETEVDQDGRMRTSYNIAGTETGRWSSSANAFGTGTNLQNISPKLRKMFIADAGWKLCGIDLEQAESREVGWLCGILFGDWSYLDACEGGDLHTTTAKLIWLSLGWTGDPKKDRQIAEQFFYRHFNYRDMSKRGGHASNYYGTAFTIGRHLKVPTKLIEDFQRAYFLAFPGIQKWHRWVAQQLQMYQCLTTPFGRTRHFFGRPNEDTTLREAIAFSPQSSTGDRMNLGLYRIWKELGTRVQILAQVHDAVYFQYREVDEAEVVPRALELVKVELQHNGIPTEPGYVTRVSAPRTFIVPGEAKVGWNWYSHHNPDKPISATNPLNPNGLKKYHGPDGRVRAVGMERVI